MSIHESIWGFIHESIRESAPEVHLRIHIRVFLPCSPSSLPPGVLPESIRRHPGVHVGVFVSSSVPSFLRDPSGSSCSGPSGSVERASGGLFRGPLGDFVSFPFTLPPAVHARVLSGNLNSYTGVLRMSIRVYIQGSIGPSRGLFGGLCGTLCRGPPRTHSMWRSTQNSIQWPAPRARSGGLFGGAL